MVNRIVKESPVRLVLVNNGHQFVFVFKEKDLPHLYMALENWLNNPELEEFGRNQVNVLLEIIQGRFG